MEAVLDCVENLISINSKVINNLARGRTHAVVKADNAVTVSPTQPLHPDSDLMLPQLDKTESALGLLTFATKASSEIEVGNTLSMTWLGIATFSVGLPSISDVHSWNIGAALELNLTLF